MIISLICEKRGLNENDILVVLGIDGGQDKLIVTITICPTKVMSKEDRRKESELKDRYKSKSTNRVIIGARVDCVPECNHNLKVLLDALELPRLHKDFRIVCDLKVVDILLGIQSCSAIHSYPYCEGYKVNKLKLTKRGFGLREIL